MSKEHRIRIQTIPLVVKPRYWSKYKNLISERGLDKLLAFLYSICIPNSRRHKEMALYASIQYSPSIKSRWIRPFERKPKLNIVPPVWYEENWTVSRTMGESQSKPSRTTCEGAGWGGQAHYDVRRVSKADTAEIEHIDREIAALQRRRVAVVEERFRTWMPVTEGDCAEIKPGKTLQAVKAELRKIKPAGKRKVQDERQLVGSLNKAFELVSR